MSQATQRLSFLIPVLCACFALTLGFSAVPVQAQQRTLNVNSVGDEGDANPGDNICATASGTCTFRAAIEEANTEIIQERWIIDFSQIPTATENGRQVARIQTNAEFRLRASRVEIRGNTAPGWQAGDPPIVYLDGSAATSNSADGLQLDATADTVSVVGLGIVAFPDDGINLISSSNSILYTSIQYCWIGVDPDGSANGNGTVPVLFTEQRAGIDMNRPSSVVIGAVGANPPNRFPNFLIPFTEGGENVIGDNADYGIYLEHSENADPSQQRTRVAVGKNYIGLLPDGTTPRGNGTYGIKIENARENYIGHVNASGERFPNYIAGNGSGGIFIDAVDTQVVGNILGTTADASSTSMALAPGQDGILLQNPSRVGVNTIGDVEGDGISGQYNIIGGYGYGIRAGTGDDSSGPNLEADREFIRENYFGVSPDGASIPLRQAGVYAQFADSLRIQGNRFGNIGSGGAEDAAISIPQSEIGNHRIENNLIGVLDDGSSHPINGDGIYIGDPGGSDSFVDENIIGNATRNGIYVFDMEDPLNGPRFRNNSIGSTPAGADIGNGDAGMRFVNSLSGIVGARATSNAATNGNLIGFNGGPGVAVTGTDSRVVIRGNQFRNNGGPMIDLGDDGNTPNDGPDGDADTGPNKLLNTPEIISFECQTGLSEDDLTLTYRVRTTNGNARFDENDGILVDLYAGSGPGHVDTYLTTDQYLNGFTNQTVTASAPNLCDQYLFLTVTDDLSFTNGSQEERSTSEFTSPAQQLPVELALFDVLPNGDRGAELVWETLSEKNNDRFEVEHFAPEASEWSRIGTKRGAGTTTERQRYTFAVSDLEVGTHAFRLRQIDVDGAAELFEEKSVEIRLSVAYELRVGPNPMRTSANGVLTLREAQTVRAVVYDVLGREVARIHDGAMEAGKNTFSIDASRLGSGRYFLRITGDSFRDTQPFTVVR